MQGYIQDCVDVGDTNGPRSFLFSIFTATFLVMGLSFVLVPELTKTGMFGAQPRLVAEDRLMWQMIGAAIATVVSPVACTQQVNFLSGPVCLHFKAILYNSLKHGPLGSLAFL